MPERMGYTIPGIDWRVKQMHPNRKTALKTVRRASVLTQTVMFGSAVGVGMAALAVDTGLMYSSKAELQNAADAAALAAASQLGTTTDAQAMAGAEAAAFSSLNKVAGNYSDLMQSDVVFGHAVLNGTKFDFNPGDLPYDAVRVTLRRDQTAADGPVSMLFGKALGVEGANLQASATAMLTPRDISIVIDLSGSMNDDTELRHYKDFASETSGTRPGVKVNLEDVWLALPCQKGNNGVGNGIDPAPPGNPSNYNDQPGTGPGSPNSQGGNTSPGADPSPGGGCGGPRWGWMTGFGNTITVGSYTPVGDPGFYYIPRYSTTTQADIVANLTEAGYSSAERTALLSGSSDSSTTNYKNRVKVLLGLAGWKSKKSGGKYNGGPGNGNDTVDNNELTQQASWSFAGGSWDDYFNYIMSGSTQMTATDSNFRYRYGIKTVVNYLLEKQANKDSCPELQDAPEMPLKSVKDAVQSMIDIIVSMETQDHVSLETFAQYGYHEVDLPDATTSSELYAALAEIPATLNQRQAGHYTSITNIGAGMQKGIQELTSPRARTSAAKVIIILTDGKPNTNSSGGSVGNDAPEAVNWALDQADEAKESGITVYTIGVGGDVNADLCEQMASEPEFYFYADSSPDPQTGSPMYVTQLQEIFNTLGTKRPVRLIQ